MATISIIDPETFEVQNYEDNDVSLIGAFSVSNKLLTPSDYIEFNVYTLSKELLLSDPNFTSYTVQNNSQTSGSEVNKEGLCIEFQFNTASVALFIALASNKIVDKVSEGSDSSAQEEWEVT